MPNKITENEIQGIIKNFKENIVEYEIIDMETQKGWSSEYLYLIVSSEDNYILKAKTAIQIAGYDNEVKISNALLANNIQARRPILTKNNEIFHEQLGYYWCLMTYIPGSPSHVNEYNENTVKSLAEHVDQYVTASLANDSLKHLDLNPPLRQSSLDILEQLEKNKDFLESENIIKLSDNYELHEVIKEGYGKFIGNSQLSSIIHNDINPRNILIDLNSKNVVSLIDWDHVRYANPLKDISDAISIFYDFLPLEKAKQCKTLFYRSFKSSWFTGIDPHAVEYALLFYYSVAKWRAVLFYLDLLLKYDNEYGERDRFISEIRNSYSKWLDTIKSVSF